MKRVIGLWAIAIVALAACSDGGNDNAANDPATAEQTAPTSLGATTVPRLTAPTSAGAPTTTNSTVASVRKANANVASLAELTAAMAANGVEDPGMWDADVIENRPYPTNDPTFTKVRQNLAEDNLSPAAIEKIVASLSL